MTVRRCDAEGLELGAGLEVLLAAVLEPCAPGDELELAVDTRSTALELPAWARSAGHEVTGERPEDGRWLVRLRRGAIRRVLAPPLPDVEPPPALRPDGPHLSGWRAGPAPERAEAAGGFVPLGAVAEAGAPAHAWRLNERDALWSDDLGQLTEGAAATQWDATRDVPWGDAGPLPEFLERAVCQVVTFIAQNEYAAYYVPARFMPAVNPQFTEVLLWLASHTHDEARHVEVFTKRALVGGAHAYALAATERSLQTLLLEPDFTASALLLNVLGEGSFIDLLQFVAAHAPDPATEAAARLAHRDELRHVRFGISHVRRVLERDPAARSSLVAAAEARAARLVDLTGISPVVTEALTVMAARTLQPAQLSEAAADVRALLARTAENRVARLLEAGFDEPTARHVSDLHTPNLM
jgi:TusA-related sulfurtransferase